MAVTIITDTRPTARQAMTFGGILAVWEEVLANTEVVVSAWDAEELVGIQRAHGDGSTWLVTQTFVKPDYRGEGLATRLRRTTITECEKRTVGNGKMYGFFTEETRGFWEHPDVPGMETRLGMGGEREIVGTKGQ